MEHKYQLIVLGGGSAGYTAAEYASKAGLKVLLIEKNKLGGVCLNEGCIPTKALLYSSKTYESFKQCEKYGVKVESVSFDLSRIMNRKAKIVRKLALGVKSKLSLAGVDILEGEGNIIDNSTILCGDNIYKFENLIISTGSKTFIPQIPGINNIDYWTHKEALSSVFLPKHITILGGGVIGMEFAGFYNALGVKVIVIEAQKEILTGIDRELATMLRSIYTKKGITFMLGTNVNGFEKSQDGTVIHFENDEGNGCLTTDKLLISVGRRPNTQGYGLERLNLEKNARGNIETNSKMQTSQPNIYVCGDLNGISMLAHTAVREAQVAVNNILGNGDEMCYNAIPNVVFTNPEVAGVGETEESVTSKGMGFDVKKIPMSFSGRFTAENEGVNGICKILRNNDGKIIGAHVLGNMSSEIIALAGQAIQLNLTASEWMKTVFPHPSVGEIFKEAL